MIFKGINVAVTFCGGVVVGKGCMAGDEVVTGGAVVEAGMVLFSDEGVDVERVQPDEPAMVRSIRKQRMVKIFMGRFYRKNGINPFFNNFYVQLSNLTFIE